MDLERTLQEIEVLRNPPNVLSSAESHHIKFLRGLRLDNLEDFTEGSIVCALEALSQHGGEYQWVLPRALETAKAINPLFQVFLSEKAANDDVLRKKRLTEEKLDHLRSIALQVRSAKVSLSGKKSRISELEELIRNYQLEVDQLRDEVAFEEKMASDSTQNTLSSIKACRVEIATCDRELAMRRDTLFEADSEVKAQRLRLLNILQQLPSLD